MPEASCSTGKLCHRSQAAARRHATGIAHITGDRQRPYWCERCRYWHLATPIPREGQPPARRTRPRRGAPPTTATVAELDAFLARHARGPRHDDDQELEP